MASRDHPPEVVPGTIHQPGLHVVERQSSNNNNVRQTPHSYTTGSTWNSPQSPFPEPKEAVVLTPHIEEKKILGLKRPTFILSALLAVLITAAAVGGGVGGSYAVAQAQKQTSAQCTPPTPTPTVTTTPTTTSSTSPPTSPSSSSSVDTPISVPTKGRIDFSCAEASKSRQIVTASSSSTTWAFELTCGHDFRGEGIDIAALTAYSFTDCLRACVSVNENAVVTNVTCQGVFFEGDLSAQVFKYGSNTNCYLKSRLSGKVADPGLSPWSAAAAEVVSGPKGG